MGDVRATELDQLVGQRGSRFAAVRRHHHRLDFLAHLFVGNADHRDVVNLRVCHEMALGFLRVDVHAARDDHVRLAIGEVEIALGVEVADVADREEIAAIRRRGLLLVLVVVEARLGIGRRLEEDRAFAHGFGDRRSVVIEQMHLAAGPVSTDGALVRQPLLRADQRAAAFGARVVLLDRVAPPLDHRLLDGDGAGRRRVHGDAQLRNVVALAHRLGQRKQSFEMRRHPLRASSRSGPG